MRQVLRVLVACLCLFLVSPAATQAGIGGKLRSKAKSTVGADKNTAQKGADKAQDTASKGVDKAKPTAIRLDQQAKPVVQQTADVFEKI